MSLANLRPGDKNEDVRQVKQALYLNGYTDLDADTEYFGPGLRQQYSKWQESLGYSGHDANGIPGRTSLEKLGFEVFR